jgi:hypothetical protein
LHSRHPFRPIRQRVQLIHSPDTYIAKVAVTPHFYQGDPRWENKFASEHYCVPVAISDALVYFADNGFTNLLPDQDNQQLAQAEIITTLVSSEYMATDQNSGTNPSDALTGLRKYIEGHGYQCTRLEYAGWRRLRPDQQQMQIGPEPDLDWIKAAIAAPNGAAWLEVGHYVHGQSPNDWKRISGHTMLAVGYGIGDNPHLFLVDNSAVKRSCRSAREHPPASAAHGR